MKNKRNWSRYSVLRMFVTALVVAGGLVLTSHPAAASSTSQLNQTINAGTLATDIKDASQNSVSSPSVSMGSVVSSFSCLTGANAATGTFGSGSQRIYVTNPGAADNGWTLTLAATGGPTSLWQNSGATHEYDFNDPTSGGCSDGSDADSYAGQLTVDPSGGTITADCSSTCTTANISLGSAAAFSEGVTDSVTLMTASSSANNFGQWYLTGVNLKQTIPAQQTPDSYNLNMTLTVTAS